MSSASAKSKAAGGANTKDKKSEDSADAKADGGKNKNDTADNGQDPKDVDIAAAENLPKFAMMANHFDCGFCHVKVYGDIGSTSDVPPARHDSEATVVGDWYSRGVIDVEGRGAKVGIGGTKKENYTGKKIPRSFPVLSFSKIKSQVKGQLEAAGGPAPAFDGKIKKKHSGNLVLIGTDSDPIELDGDVFVDGDLVIGGVYKGIGTIYVSGVIAIPQDLKAKKSPFPYPEGEDAAAKRASKVVKDDTYDGLGLASAKTIFIGDLDTTIIGDGGAPYNSAPDRAALYGWLPKSDFAQFFMRAADCRSGSAAHDRSLELVDAFLYAKNSIEGKVKGTSTSIRGGFVTDYYNVLNADANCRGVNRTSDAHGHPADGLYIEYDWRLQTGRYPVLEHLGKAIDKQSD